MFISDIVYGGYFVYEQESSKRNHQRERHTPLKPEQSHRKAADLLLEQTAKKTDTFFFHPSEMIVMHSFGAHN